MGQKHIGAPQRSEPPAVRGGTGQGGAPRRAATKRSTPKGAVSCVASCNEGQERACDMVRLAYTVTRVVSCMG